MIYFLLFWEFFKTGLFAIGGGLATIPFLMDMADTQKEGSGNGNHSPSRNHHRHGKTRNEHRRETMYHCQIRPHHPANASRTERRVYNP